jgi:AcrR family transcriptional regulator
MPRKKPETKRPPVDLEQRRARYLAAATDLLLDKGLQAASMNDLAGNLGVPKMLIYRAFADKQALVAAVLDPVIDTIDDLRDAPWTGYGSRILLLFEKLMANHKAALLVLRDCRSSAEHQKWFERARQLISDQLLLFFTPAPQSPKGAKSRARCAADMMATFYIDTLVTWLEDRDGLTNDARIAWFSSVIRVWRAAARQAFKLGPVEESPGL